MIKLETKFAIRKFWMNFLWGHHCTQICTIMRQAKEMEKSDKMTFEFGKKSSAQGPCSKDIDYMDYYCLLCILGSSASIVLAWYVTNTCGLFEVYTLR